MRNLFITLGFCFFFTLSLWSQVTQKGIVKEYNTNGKTLSGVGISIPSANDYQPTMSNSDGSFQLYFSHHKAGDLIYNIRIIKDDYEIVNIHDFKNGWKLSPNDTLTIIVAHRNVIADRRSHYYNIMDRYTEKEYKKKIASLNEELSQQKINVEEYRQKVIDAEKELKKAYDKIDEYADMFARINTETFDSISHLALDYLQDGKVNLAIQLYENQNLVEQLNKKVAIRDQAEESIQQIIPKLQEEMAFRQIAGGKNNIERVDLIHNSIVSANPDNFEFQKDYFFFLVDQNKLDKAKSVGTRAYSLAHNPVEKSVTLSQLGLIQYRQGHYDDAKQYLQEALAENNKLKNDNSEIFLVQQSQNLNILATIYIDEQNFTKAEECLKECAEYGRQLLKYDSSYLEKYSSTLSNISELYRSIGEVNQDRTTLGQALEYNQASLDLLQFISDTDKVDKPLYAAARYNNRGSIFLELNQNDSALYYIGKSDSLWNIYYPTNMNKYTTYRCHSLNNLAIVYSRLQQYEKAHQAFDKVLAICDSSNSPMLLRETYVATLTSKGVLLRREKKYKEAINIYLHALALQMEISKDKKEKYSQKQSYLYENLATASFFSKDYQTAISYFQASRNHVQGLQKEKHKSFETEVAKYTYYIAYCYYNLNDAKHGIPEYKKARKMYLKFNKTTPGKYAPALADIDKEMKELKNHKK
ncbi:MAG: tetratricopeptide repeat protein [Bacteroidales bacterium]|nr:tetratricopeptide repeat protein [Bacteroidales bacterium]